MAAALQQSEDDSEDDELFGDVFAAMREAEASSSTSEDEEEEASTDVTVERVCIDSLSAVEFAARFSAASVPVVLTNAEAYLPMHLTVDYWWHHYGHKKLPLEINSPKRRDAPLADFLRFDDPTLKELYLRNLHLGDWFDAEVGAGVGIPLVMGRNHLIDRDRVTGCPETWRTWNELFICDRSCRGFPFLHRDICNTHAYSFQIEGLKEFSCFPPSDGPFLYPEPASVAGFSRNRSSLPDCSDVDLDRFPLFKNATKHVARLRPGEILFLPANWWHTAKCISATPSVTIGGNYVDDSVYDAFADAFADYKALRGLANVGATTLKLC